MKSFRTFTEAFDAPPVVKHVRRTFYHGTLPQNVASILAHGFSLSHSKPNWTNDYGVSALRSAAAVHRYFGTKRRGSTMLSVISFSFDGQMGRAVDMDRVRRGSAQDYTSDMIKLGIDAVELDGDLGQVVIYNLACISRLKIIP